MRTNSIVSANQTIQTTKDRQEARLSHTKTLRIHKTEGSNNTMCKAKQLPDPAGPREAAAEDGVEAREAQAAARR